MKGLVCRVNEPIFRLIYGHILEEILPDIIPVDVPKEPATNTFRKSQIENGLQSLHLPTKPLDTLK